MEERIGEEAKRFIDYIDDNTGKDLSIHSILSMSISNNIGELVFGKRFELNHKLLNKILRQNGKISETLLEYFSFECFTDFLIETVSQIRFNSQQ